MPVQFTKQFLSAERFESAGVFDVIESEVKAGMTVAEVIAVLKRYYDDAGLTGTPGWVLGYEMGLSLPPDWVGDFYFHFMDTKYLDRVFEENMVTISRASSRPR